MRRLLLVVAMMVTTAAPWSAETALAANLVESTCRGDMARASNPTNEYFENMTFIGDCHFENGTAEARAILSKCRYGQLCVVKATIQDGNIVTVHRAEVGRDVTATCDADLIRLFTKGQEQKAQEEIGVIKKNFVEWRIGDCPFSASGEYGDAGRKILDVCRENYRCRVRAVIGATIKKVISVDSRYPARRSR